MLQVRQLSLVTLHTLLFAGTSSLHFIFLFFFLSSFLLIKLYPCNYLSRECGLYKASDLLLGDHVCEKFDAVKWIDCQ